MSFEVRIDFWQKTHTHTRRCGAVRAIVSFDSSSFPLSLSLSLYVLEARAKNRSFQE